MTIEGGLQFLETRLCVTLEKQLVTIEVSETTGETFPFVTQGDHLKLHQGVILESVTTGGHPRYLEPLQFVTRGVMAPLCYMTPG